MLIQFNFQNYKSFRDDTTLDLTATKISEHSSRVVHIANDKLLRIAAIYGANASGKSNVHDAFKFMSAYVLTSFEFGGDNDSKNNRKRRSMTVKSFMFDKASRTEKSTFEVFFIDQNDPAQKSYQYGFSLKDTEVVEEWLYYKSKSARGKYKTIFYRGEGKLELDGIPKKSAENIEIALERETLVVSLGAKLKIAKLKMVRDWFYDNEVIDFSNDMESLFRSNTLPKNFVEDTAIQDKVVKFFESFDNSIVGFEVKKVSVEDDSDDRERFIINAKHRVIGTDETAAIPLQEESKGTLEMFSLFPFMQEVLEKGSVLFVDELNTKLHPLLVRNIIVTFANPEINTKNAQLIFTTHDSWQLSNNLLRRDEIWFTEKDSGGVSALYSLADFTDEDGAKIRKDESYEKNYLLGKYGAIPTLKTIDLFKGE